MSEDIGDASGLAGNLEDADGPRPDRYLSDEGDGDDLLAGCACGEKPKCFYLDPSDCARARQARSQPQEVRETATEPTRIREDEGGVWVAHYYEGHDEQHTSVHPDELNALRAALQFKGEAKFLKWGEWL